MEFLYSINDERFHYKELTVVGDEKIVCLTKEEHADEQFREDFVITGEQDGWDKDFVKELNYQGRNKTK